MIFLFCFDVVFLVQFLRTRPRTTKELLGLLSICLITLAALVGLIFVEVHTINTFKSGSYFLFMCALFAEQVIAQWTLNDQALKSAHVSVRWIWIIFTIFVIVFTLFVLIVVIFQL